MQAPFKNSSISSRVVHRLFQPVDNSPLIVFRIVFGCLLFFHCSSFILSGKLFENFIQPPFTFTYIGFEFLQPLPGNGMYYYFWLMAALGLMIMLGAWYRLAMAGFTILWTLVYLMQKSNYNNHYYLILLLCLLMCFLPANRYCSVDVKRRPEIKSKSCCWYIPFLMMAQTAIIYFYAATSKLNASWLSGKFITVQFAHLARKRIIGPIYGNPYFQWFIVYGGFLFDLLIIPFLCWKKTRSYAFILFCGFHIFNFYSFSIGIFPWLSIAMAVFFFTPGKIQQLFFKNKPALAYPAGNRHSITGIKKLIVGVLSGYLLIQLVLPLRSSFYPGNVFWTEEGYRMSWKMMLRTKTGKIYFKITDPASAQTWYDYPAEKFAPSHTQFLAVLPDVVWQYAQWLKKEYVAKGFPQAEVFAIDSVSLNKNPARLLIDTTVNLAAVPWHHFRHSEWILPYKEP